MESSRDGSAVVIENSHHEGQHLPATETAQLTRKPDGFKGAAEYKTECHEPLHDAMDALSGISPQCSSCRSEALPPAKPPTEQPSLASDWGSLSAAASPTASGCSGSIVTGQLLPQPCDSPPPGCMEQGSVPMSLGESLQCISSLCSPASEATQNGSGLQTADDQAEPTWSSAQPAPGTGGAMASAASDCLPPLDECPCSAPAGGACKLHQSVPAEVVEGPAEDDAQQATALRRAAQADGDTTFTESSRQEKVEEVTLPSFPPAVSERTGLQPCIAAATGTEPNWQLQCILVEAERNGYREQCRSLRKQVVALMEECRLLTKQVVALMDEGDKYKALLRTEQARRQHAEESLSQKEESLRACQAMSSGELEREIERLRDALRGWKWEPLDSCSPVVMPIRMTPMVPGAEAELTTATTPMSSVAAEPAAATYAVAQSAVAGQEPSTGGVARRGPPVHRTESYRAGCPPPQVTAVAASAARPRGSPATSGRGCSVGSVPATPAADSPSSARSAAGNGTALSASSSATGSVDGFGSAATSSAVHDGSGGDTSRSLGSSPAMAVGSGCAAAWERKEEVGRYGLMVSSEVEPQLSDRDASLSELGALRTQQVEVVTQETQCATAMLTPNGCRTEVAGQKVALAAAAVEPAVAADMPSSPSDMATVYRRQEQPDVGSQAPPGVRHTDLPRPPGRGRSNGRPARAAMMGAVGPSRPGWSTQQSLVSPVTSGSASSSSCSSSADAAAAAALDASGQMSDADDHAGIVRDSPGSVSATAAVSLSSSVGARKMSLDLLLREEQRLEWLTLSGHTFRARLKLSQHEMETVKGIANVAMISDDYLVLATQKGIRIFQHNQPHHVQIIHPDSSYKCVATLCHQQAYVGNSECSSPAAGVALVAGNKSKRQVEVLSPGYSGGTWHIVGVPLPNNLPWCLAVDCGETVVAVGSGRSVHIVRLDGNGGRQELGLNFTVSALALTDAVLVVASSEVRETAYAVEGRSKADPRSLMWRQQLQSPIGGLQRDRYDNCYVLLARSPVVHVLSASNGSTLAEITLLCQSLHPISLTFDTDCHCFTVLLSDKQTVAMFEFCGKLNVATHQSSPSDLSVAASPRCGSLSGSPAPRAWQPSSTCQVAAMEPSTPCRPPVLAVLSPLARPFLPTGQPVQPVLPAPAGQVSSVSEAVTSDAGHPPLAAPAAMINPVGPANRAPPPAAGHHRSQIGHRQPAARRSH